MSFLVELCSLINVEFLKNIWRFSAQVINCKNLFPKNLNIVSYYLNQYCDFSCQYVDENSFRIGAFNVRVFGATKMQRNVTKHLIKVRLSDIYAEVLPWGYSHFSWNQANFFSLWARQQENRVGRQIKMTIFDSLGR